MCRKKQICTELGDDPAQWSRRAPLPPPLWAREAIVRLREAMSLAARGDRPAAYAVLDEIDSDRLRAWGAEHGQVSGTKRSRGAKKGTAGVPRSSPRIPDRTRAAVHERDGFHCRYCETPVIVRPAIKALAQYVAGPRFSFGSTLESRHGAALLAVAQVDHLVPRSSGGGLDLDNLVTACWACNYGKDGYTLEQLGIEDPRAREPLHTAWDGGSASVAPLKQLCAD